MLQKTALSILGMFVFMRSTLPYQNRSREISWRHPTNSVIGALPKAQFLGKESEKITISGDLFPEITGGELSLRALELMADSGGSFPLINGNFFLEGYFVIERISEQSTVFDADGKARKISFTIELKRTDDAMALEIARGIMNRL